MRYSAKWFWLIAAALQKPGLSTEVQNPRPAEAEVTVAQAGLIEDRKAEVDRLLKQGV